MKLLFWRKPKTVTVQQQRGADIRAHPDWTQKRFAELWGVSVPTVGAAIQSLYFREAYLHPRAYALAKFVEEKQPGFVECPTCHSYTLKHKDAE